MKKIIVMVVAALIASVSVADVGVELLNSGGLFTTDGSSYLDRAFVQLVWNDGTTVESGSGIQVNSVLVAAGDSVLVDFTTTSGYAGTWTDLGDMGGIFANANVGGVNILNGYLTVRVFNAANMGVGVLGFEYDVDIDGTLTQYDPLNLSTKYSTDGLISGGNFGALAAGNANVVQVVPEPATALLFGIGGFGAWLVRRNKLSSKYGTDA